MRQILCYGDSDVYKRQGQETTLLTKKAGDIVNLENDVIGKYVEHLLHFKEPDNKKQSSKVDMGFLAEHGFL